jgi:transposase
MELLQMSKKELSRVEVMERMKTKKMTQKKGAAALGISVRQIRRLKKIYEEKGSAGLINKSRGKPSNNRLSSETRQQAIDLLHSLYTDFGPTFAHEKLVEEHDLALSSGSVRQIMIRENLWIPRKVKKIVAHQLRERRACFGELVQIDGSPHRWFEDRAPACTLLVFVDDATGKLGELRFVKSESLFSYAEASRAYIERHGKPLVFYSDKHGIFRVNQSSVGAGESLTQFGRAMQELEIAIICANTPQAKGRVERINLTLQDRLVKEMRLRGISSMEEGNAYLPEFTEDFNRRFAVVPRSNNDAHRPLLLKDNLDQILTWQETRIISKNLSVQFKNVVYQIQTDRPTYALRKTKVTVCLNPDGKVTILYKGKELAYKIFKTQTKQSQILSSKDVDRKVDKVRKQHKPAPDHPWRKGFATPLSGPIADISTLSK